jgi:hypothetical protein
MCVTTQHYHDTRRRGDQDLSSVREATLYFLRFPTFLAIFISSHLSSSLHTVADSFLFRTELFIFLFGLSVRKFRL